MSAHRTGKLLVTAASSADRERAARDAFELAVGSPQLLALNPERRARRIRLSRVWTGRQRLAVFGGDDAT